MKRQLSRIEREVILSRMATKEVDLILSDGVTQYSLNKDQWNYRSSFLEISASCLELLKFSLVNVFVSLHGKIFLFSAKATSVQAMIVLTIPSVIYSFDTDTVEHQTPTAILESQNWSVTLSYPEYLNDLLTRCKVPIFASDSVIASVSLEIQDFVMQKNSFRAENESLALRIKTEAECVTRAAVAVSTFNSNSCSTDRMKTESERPWYLLHVDHQLLLIGRYSSGMSAPEETILTLHFTNRTVRSTLVQIGILKTDNSVVVVYYQSVLAEEDKRFLFERCFGRPYV